MDIKFASNVKSLYGRSVYLKRLFCVGGGKKKDYEDFSQKKLVRKEHLSLTRRMSMNI